MLSAVSIHIIFLCWIYIIYSLHNKPNVPVPMFLSEFLFSSKRKISRKIALCECWFRSKFNCIRSPAYSSLYWRIYAPPNIILLFTDTSIIIHPYTQKDFQHFDSTGLNLSLSKSEPSQFCSIIDLKLYNTSNLQF